MNKELKETYLLFTDKLDKHEKFKEYEFKEFIGLCTLALEGFKEVQ